MRFRGVIVFTAGLPPVQVFKKVWRVGEQRRMPEVPLRHLPAAAREQRGVDVQPQAPLRLVLADARISPSSPPPAPRMVFPLRKP